MYNIIMSDTILQYRRCPCCGNYFTVGDSENVKTIFCSPECRVAFRQCCVCGNWYEADNGYEPEDEPLPADMNVCSAECAKVLTGHHKSKQV